MARTTPRTCNRPHVRRRLPGRKQRRAESLPPQSISELASTTSEATAQREMAPPSTQQHFRPPSMCVTATEAERFLFPPEPSPLVPSSFAATSPSHCRRRKSTRQRRRQAVSRGRRNPAHRRLYPRRRQLCPSLRRQRKERHCRGPWHRRRTGSTVSLCRPRHPTPQRPRRPSPPLPDPRLPLRRPYRPQSLSARLRLPQHSCHPEQARPHGRPLRPRPRQRQQRRLPLHKRRICNRQQLHRPFPGRRLRPLRKLQIRNRHQLRLQHALVGLPVRRRRSRKHHRLQLRPLRGLRLPHQVPRQARIAV